jgi:hypothetical protein
MRLLAEEDVDMPRFTVTLLRTLQQSACITVRVKDAAAAEASIAAKLDKGFSWEDLTKDVDVEEVEHRISIDDVAQESWGRRGWPC